MSIPVYLRPLQPVPNEASNGIGSSTTVEVVLDQSAIETLMECTAVQFRDLVRVDETRARQVKKESFSSAKGVKRYIMA